MATKVSQSNQQEYEEKAYVFNQRRFLRNVKFHAISISG